ncbi:hypothetical protein [Novosphingobium album (ex Liu et al. 2023)]|uniref:Uncharacterized protein n=1 Tax=Novosphingobium album (ex Liu et al. 2023) TaxID=3031130 RepID=A0ABT5WVB4_9SPHN|nr:hypothetical protein [Novosphingobium album (ex Liu et al. 2023)]MDE8653840.1 hypothetical protein [Novosphingobium album (ex Liu et al. 2023)]
MANHSIEINKKMAGVVGICTAIAFGYLDHQYAPFGNPFMTGMISGLVAWGIGYSDVKAGSGIMLIDALVFGAGLLGNP